MSLRTQAQNSRFHQLLSQHKIDAETKLEIVKTASDGRCESSSDLSRIEMAKAIKALEVKSDGQLKRMRAKALNLSRNLGLVTGEKPNIDYNKLNNWLDKYFKIKAFYKIENTAVLSKVITSLENWKKTLNSKV